MRRTLLEAAFCWVLVSHDANAKPAAPAAIDVHEIPSQVNVSQVSNDGPAVHNRLTFDCEASSSGAAPPQIACVMVQQNLQEGSPEPSKAEFDKEMAEMTGGDKLKALCQENLAARSGPDANDDAEFRSRVAKACAKTNRADAVAALGDVYRQLAHAESQMCKLLTVVRKITFTRVKPGVWVSSPAPLKSCPNVTVTGTLRRDARAPNSWFWNYTESTSVGPSKDALCQAKAETTEFTWENAVTPTPARCAYVSM